MVLKVGKVVTVSPLAFNQTYLKILPEEEPEPSTLITFSLHVMVSGFAITTVGLSLSSIISTNKVSEELNTVFVAIKRYTPGQFRLISVVPCPLSKQLFPEKGLQL